VRGLLLGGAERGPITVDARRFEADNRKRTATYVDKVVVRQEDTTLMADRLTVSYDDARQISEVRAEGNVRIVQKTAASAAPGAAPAEREVLCARIVFSVPEDRIVCTGSPAMLRQGDDQIRGPRITVLVADERIVVEGEGAQPRVTSRITPRPEGPGREAQQKSPRAREAPSPGQGASRSAGSADETSGRGRAGTVGQAGSARPD
jgi:lipopolysaccharide transport protein LptA